MLLPSALVSCVLGLALATPLATRSKEEVQAFRSFLESTKIAKDGNARFAVQAANNNPELNGKFQGDIVLDDYQIENMVFQYSMGRNAYKLESAKWPENTVVWQFGEGEFDDLQKAAILEGIKDIEAHSCVKFRYREPTDVNFVNLTGVTNGCYAHIGFGETRGPHILNLGRDEVGVGCFRHATIVHEWMHSLGFMHMHATYNRDDYVQILWENIRPGVESNFNKFSSDLLDNLGVEYDYVSCLQYGPDSLSVNGEPTILATREHEGVMGQRDYVTDKDWLRINRHYNCAGAWD